MGRAFVPPDTETTKPPDPMSGGFFSINTVSLKPVSGGPAPGNVPRRPSL